MTTIAFDGRTLAADTLLTAGSMRCGEIVKIRQVKGCLVGFCGSLTNFERFYSWFMAGMSGEFHSDGGNVFIIPPTGHAVVWGDGGPWRETAAQWALGDGEQVAVGAMVAGADAAGAVRVAMAINVNTGGDITVLKREA